MGLSVYLHVPFCASRCPYCAFYSGEPAELLPSYPALLAAEAALRSPQWRGPVSTVYFGGGTPSLLRPRAVADVLEALDRVWRLEPGAEITLEANPASRADHRGLRSAGVTRLSIGVQSLSDEVLARLGRAHRAAEALACLREAGRAGFERVSADLLFGVPGLSPGLLRESARTLLEAGAGHVSTYALEVHEGTVLADALREGSFRACSPEEEETQWQLLDEALAAAGLSAYEVSNYSLPGHRCRHNLAYWEGVPYVGLGPGAHSYRPDAGRRGARSWNAPGLAAYARDVAAGRLPPGGAEELAADEALLEELFLALRRPVELDFDDLCRRHELAQGGVRRRFGEALTEGLLRAGSRPGAFVPTAAGLRRADGLALWLLEGFAAPVDGGC
ncbi:MAG: coproporphyrinogen III oxidase family protein [Deltaproteobacteria bacterium]|nr:coproporphyrinogen III oxidase family protein [Deltaproteobacteria bacterium]